LRSEEELNRDLATVPAPAGGDAAQDVWQHPSFLPTLTLILLIEFAIAAWVVLFSGNHISTETMLAVLPAMHFLLDWEIMMVAMMFPSAALMIFAFYKDQAVKRQPEAAFISTWVFVTAYLLVWAVAGIAAYTGLLVAESAASHLDPAVAAQCGVIIILLAGLYQFTPFKETCLSECRTPIDMTTWRRATAGSFRMGLLHGVYCIGCNWLLFAALFPLGMSITAMAVITLIVLAEKTLPWPRAASYTAGVGLVLYGALLIASAQPTIQNNGSAPMPSGMQMKMPGR
jgi:predicted metal-binding membrane protein